MISPRFRETPEGRSIDFFTVVFVVGKASHLVFFIGIKSPGDHASRAAADDQMRSRFFGLVDDTQLPVLHGVSALGTRLCFNSLSSEANPPLVNDVAPADWRNIDLLSEEGVTKLTEVVGVVKAMVASHEW